MSSEITNDVASVLIPEIWRPGFLKALYQKAVVKNRVLSADGDVKQMGDILHIILAPTGTVNDVATSSGAITNQALTATEAQLTVNKWKDYTFTVVDNTGAQARKDLDAVLGEGAPKAFAKQIDVDLLSLYSSMTDHTAIDASGGLILDNLLTAFYNLANSAVEMDDPNNLSWAFHWKQYQVLKKIAQLNEAQITGEGVGGMLKFRVPDILGIPVFFTSGVQSSSSLHQNMLFHRESMACGVQKNFRMEQMARTAKATTYSADMMYGVKAVRSFAACVIKTTA